jgi:nucleotide-binding universal stress UspA family protein
MKILAIYDGTIHAKKALQYGLRKAKEKNAELIVLQVFQSSLFVDYDAGPMAEAAARAEADRYRHEAEAIIAAEGLTDQRTRMVRREGDPIEEALALIQAEKTELTLAPPAYKAVARSTHPVYVMPGTILVPVDSSETLKTDLETIIAEAKATASQVLLLGIVPIHLYSSSEQVELDQITNKTAASLKKTAIKLNAKGVETKEVMCSGYPDEEILKAAEKYTASLIMLPSGGKTPSELAKAAAILQDEPDRVRLPLYIVDDAEA